MIGWIAKNLANSMYLVDLTRARKEWTEIDQFRHDCAKRPHVNGVRIVSAQKQDLWRAIPPGGNVLGIGGRACSLSCETEISEFNDGYDVLLCGCGRGCDWGQGAVFKETGCGDENILWLHVPVKITRSMYVVEAGDDLSEDGGHEATCEGTAFSSLDEMIQIALHTLENKVELLGVWEEKEVVEGYDVWVERDCAKRLQEG